MSLNEKIFLDFLLIVNVLVIGTCCFYVRFSEVDESLDFDVRTEKKKFLYSINMTLSIMLYYLIVSVAYWVLRYQGKNLDLAYLGLVVSLGSVLSILQSVFSVLYAPLVFRREHNDGMGLVYNIIGGGGILAVFVFSKFGFLLSYILSKNYHVVIGFFYLGLMIPLLYVLMEVFSVNLSLHKKNSYIVISNLGGVVFLVSYLFILYSRLNYVICLYGIVSSLFFVLVLKNFFSNNVSDVKIPILNKNIIFLIVCCLLNCFDFKFYCLFVFVVGLIFVFSYHKDFRGGMNLLLGRVI